LFNSDQCRAIRLAKKTLSALSGLDLRLALVALSCIERFGSSHRKLACAVESFCRHDISPEKDEMP
jgi:hypothetical protein